MRQRFLHGIIFSVIWLGGTLLMIEQGTHHGSVRAFGLSRSQLLIVSPVLGGLLWGVYYALFFRGRVQNTKA